MLSRQQSGDYLDRVGVWWGHGCRTGRCQVGARLVRQHTEAGLVNAHCCVERCQGNQPGLVRGPAPTLQVIFSVTGVRYGLSCSAVLGPTPRA